MRGMILRMRCIRILGRGRSCRSLYITPELLSAADWDTLAEAAKWARANAETLKDTHWVGGDPKKGEVYVDGRRGLRR